MVKRLIILCLVVCISAGLLTGCGAVKSSSDETAAATVAASADVGEAVENKTLKATFSEEAANNNRSKGEAETPAGQEPGAIGGTGNAAPAAANLILDQRKIIRTANVSILVDNYDKTYGQIQTLVENVGIGYIQQSGVSKHGESGKSGMVVVRVDAEKFSQVLNNVKGLGEIIEANENAEDVTDKFYDVESELRLLKYEQSRLEEYLKKISDPDIIFKTESRLTDIRHQIENLTGTLNKLGNLVKLSTITINITEKEKGADIANNKEKSYWTKLSKGFSDSLRGVGEFFSELSLFLVRAFPILVLLGFFGWIGFVLYRKWMKEK